MKPSPGSDEARAAGCKCPVIDNCHGRGYRHSESGPLFVFSSACPLHREEHDEAAAAKGAM